MVVLQLVAAMVEMIGNARQTGTCLADTFVNLPKKISFSHQQDLCYSQTERNFKPKTMSGLAYLHFYQHPINSETLYEISPGVFQ